MNVLIRERNLENTNQEKGKIITRNVTKMDKALRCEKIEGLKYEIVDQINHVRLSKKFHLLLELVGATGRLRTDAFDKKYSNIQLKWKFEFPSVEKIGSKSWKT